jgi:hypothetical protein
MGWFYAERRSSAAAAAKAIIVSKSNATSRAEHLSSSYMGYERRAADVPGLRIRTHFWYTLHRMALELTLRIVVEQPPPGVDYALQKGKGSVYETVQRQRSEGGDLVFEFQPSIKEGVTDGMSSLAGPFVQGPPRQRFVYLDIGTYAGQTGSCWSRRLKVPLEGITAKMVGKGGVLKARIPGTCRDGSPTCATVKEFEGWKLPSG